MDAATETIIYMEGKLKYYKLQNTVPEIIFPDMSGVVLDDVKVMRVQSSG